MNYNNTKRISFGKEIDLKDLEKEYETDTPEFKEWFEDRYKGEFLGFTWIDLSLKNPTDPEFTNVDIRDEQNEGMSVEDMQYSFRADGWIMPPKFGDKFFPLVDLLGIFDDGRTRGLAGIEENERWMVGARIKKPDSSLTSKISTGFCANIFVPNRTIKPKDYIKGTLKLIKSGELKRDRTDIEFFLTKKGNIHKKWPDNAGGWITKIINAIMEQSENPSVSSSRKLDDKQWRSYLKKCDLYGIDGKRLNVNQISIFKIPSRTAKARVIYRILEKASIKEHTYIALYCKDDFDAKQIRFHLNDFMTSTDKTHDQILNYANLSLGEINNLNKLNDKKLYTFIILPTIIDDAKHDSAYKNYQVFDRDNF